MSDFAFFVNEQRQQNIKALLSAAKAGKKRAQKRLQKELNLKIADKKTLARINLEHARGTLITERSWL